MSKPTTRPEPAAGRPRSFLDPNYGDGLAVDYCSQCHEGHVTRDGLCWDCRRADMSAPRRNAGQSTLAATLTALLIVTALSLVLDPRILTLLARLLGE